MSFQFSAKKACEAAAVLLKAHPGNRMEYLRLLKLLYASERESWRRYAQPLLGGRLVALDHGPLHSEVYDLIKGDFADQEFWQNSIRTEDYSVHLIRDPEIAKLSDADIELLLQVAEEHRQQSEWEIVEWTHQFEEWRSSYRPSTSTTIPESKLLLAVGFTPDEQQILIADRLELEAEIKVLRAPVSKL